VRVVWFADLVCEQHLKLGKTVRLVRGRGLLYSKVTKKGQVTIPSHFRKEHGFGEGTVVAFKETRHGLVIESVRDITESAGELSKFGAADEVIRDLIRSRELAFR
jgi:AbrB family looped-hinge helix DNA binding protein